MNRAALNVNTCCQSGKGEEQVLPVDEFCNTPVNSKQLSHEGAGQEQAKLRDFPSASVSALLTGKSHEHQPHGPMLMLPSSFGGWTVTA